MVRGIPGCALQSKRQVTATCIPYNKERNIAASRLFGSRGSTFRRSPALAYILGDRGAASFEWALEQERAV